MRECAEAFLSAKLWSGKTFMQSKKIQRGLIGENIISGEKILSPLIIFYYAINS